MIRLSFYISLLILFFCTFGSYQTDTACAAAKQGVSPSQTSDYIQLRQEMLKREKDALDKLQKDITARKKNRDKKLSDLQHNRVTDEMLEETRLAMEAARVNVESAKLDLSSEQRKVALLQAQIQDSKSHLSTLKNKKGSKAEVAALTKKLEETKSTLTVEQDFVPILSNKIQLLQEKADLEASWWQSVQAVYQGQQLMQHQESLDEMKQRLQKQEEQASKESASLEKELSSIRPDDPLRAMKQQLIKKKIEYMEESLDILRTRINLQSMKSRYDSLDLSGKLDSSPEKLMETLKVLQDLQAHIEPLIAVTSGKLQIIQQEWSLLQKQYALKNISDYFFNRQKKLFNDLIDKLTSLLNSLKAFEVQINQDITRVNTAHSRSVKQSLTARQIIPTDLAAWKSMGTELVSLPVRLEHIFSDMFKTVKTGWQQADNERKIIFAGICVLLLFAVFLTGLLPDIKDVPANLELRLSARVRAVTFALLRTSHIGILAGGIPVAAAWIFGMETRQFHILLLFIIVFFTLPVAIKFSYLVFASRLVAPSRRQLRLHHMISVGLFFGAIFALLMGLANAGLLSETLKGIIDRMFMFMLLLSVYFFHAAEAPGNQQDQPEKKGQVLGAHAGICKPVYPFNCSLRSRSRTCRLY